MIATTMQRIAPPSGRPPEINLAPRDVAALADELSAYHALFAPLFARAEQRRGALCYLQGQLLDLERKTIEPLALALPGGDVQALQQFIGQSTWDAEAVLLRHQEIVAQTRGDVDTGVLIVDGCDFPKQGPESVGVARQWCGALGKIANCQASVVACYASCHGYTLVDRRLYLPEKWVTPAYAARRARCGVPPELTFRTKPQLAGDIVAAVRGRGVLPFRYVTGDEGCGANTALLDQLAAADLVYLAEVPHTTRVWREQGDGDGGGHGGGGRGVGGGVACGGLVAPVDQGGGQGAAGGGHRPRAGARHARRPAGAGGVGGPAPQPGRRADAQSVPLQRGGGHPAGDAGLAVRHALAGRDGHPGSQGRGRLGPL